MVNLPSRESVTILYDFERIQRRCYTCQRLTHEQEKCSIIWNKRKVHQENQSQALSKGER